MKNRHKFIHVSRFRATSQVCECADRPQFGSFIAQTFDRVPRASCGHSFRSATSAITLQLEKHVKAEHKSARVVSKPTEKEERLPKAKSALRCDKDSIRRCPPSSECTMCTLGSVRRKHCARSHWKRHPSGTVFLKASTLS